MGTHDLGTIRLNIQRFIDALRNSSFAKQHALPNEVSRYNTPDRELMLEAMRALLIAVANGTITMTDLRTNG